MDITLQVAQLAMMLGSDRPSGKLDVLYVPGLSVGMLESANILDIAAGYMRRGNAAYLAFNGSDGSGALNAPPGSAWPGKDYYVTELLKRDVPQGALVPTGPGMHTRDETDKFVLAAKNYSWKRAGYLTVAYHYPRVFSCLVKSMQEMDYDLDVWACSPPTTNWYHPMLGSQGLEQTRSVEAALDDVRKCITYVERGYGASFDKVFSYLEARER